MKKRTVLKKFTSLLVVCATVISYGYNSNVTQNVVADSSVLSNEFTWTREIYDGVKLTSTNGESESGMQKIYTTEFNPKTSLVEPVLSYGDYVMGGDIMSEMISQIENEGKKVVFAINGDAYDTSNGVSSGLMIRDGILISTSNGSEAVGFKNDGSIVYGQTDLNIEAFYEGEKIEINHVNKERKLNESNVYLLTEQFDETTKSTQAGVEVTLSVKTDNYRGLEIGKEIEAVVESINKVENNPDKNNTPINNGELVISTHKNSPLYARLCDMEVGKKLTINIENNNQDVDWTGVDQALGIFHILMKDGNVNESYLTNTEIHPRTVFGTKADGNIVLFQCDGRQPGYADGFTFKEIIEYMKSLGCINVFNFDGGGSSTYAATLPGEKTATILNQPSDGNERANCNALLFVATADEIAGNPVEKLHIYPENGYENKVLVLEDGKMKFDVGASDRNYFYSPVSKDNLAYSTEGNIGTIDSEGTFTATKGRNEGKVVVSTINSDVKSEIEVNTVDTITKLVADRSILSVAPGATTKLEFKAEYNGIPVNLTSEALTFKLSDNSLGTISNDGTFVASDVQGTGQLEISYKDCIVNLPVEIGKLPVLLNDFESSLEESGWMWRYTNPQNGGSGKMSINYDERFVKAGDGSLRIDYDFATKPVTGTIAIESGPKEPFYLEGQPKAIGCWVYGDGNGAWLRIQLAPAAYVGDTYVDWVGWRYIETEIPSTASFPYRLIYGVRLLCTPSTGVQNKKGTIYVDGLRAVYDFKNDDNDAPELVPETEVLPANGAVNIDNQPEISMTVRDPQIEGRPYTGINSERTKLWINGKVMNNVLHETQSDGSVKVSYIPSALTPLRAGLNKIKYRIEDNAGNKFFKEWEFNVEGYNVNLIETAPEGEKAYSGMTFDYVINANNYKLFEEFELDLSFDPNYVSLINVEPDKRLTVNESIIDQQNGSVKLNLADMKKFELDLNNPLVKFKFKIEQNSGGLTGIKINKANVKETGEVTGTNLVLEGYDKEIVNKYILTWKGSTVDGKTTLTVKDINSNPVADMEVKALKDGEEINIPTLTDKNGEIVTNLFGKYPVDSVFDLWVEDRDGSLSNKAKLTVFDSLGSINPSKIVVTTGEDPSTSVGISWETNLSVESGQVVLSENEDMSNPIIINATGKNILTSLNSYERNYQAWGAHINNLKPATKYYYKVGNENGYSEIKTFTTAKQTGDITIGFYGDIQGAYDKFPDTIEQLQAMYPKTDLNLIAGDVADNGHIYSDWSSIDSNFGEYLSNGIWSATIGNHDSYFDAQTFTSFFYGPNNGTYQTARNYWFTIGDMVIYNLDTEAVYSYDPDFQNQIRKMEEVFNSSDKKYKIVLMHRSAYPLNYDELDVRELHKTFDKLGVDLVLSGHDHIYNRTKMYDNNKVDIKEQGTMYIVGGTASGSKYYDADINGRPWQDVVYDDNNPIFSVLKQRDGKLYFEAYAIENGNSVKIDEIEIQSNQLSNVNKTALQVAIEMANEVTEEQLDKVVEAVANEFKAALANAIAVNEDANTTQAEVNNAFDRLAKAMHMLDFIKGDKTDLINFIEQVSNLDGEYTPATKVVFDEALKAANEVVADENALQVDVEKAYNDLVTAFLNLRLVPNKDLLNDLIDEAQGLDATSYTVESYNVMLEALENAKIVALNENATQAEVDNAKDALTKAIENLQATTTTVDNKVETPVKGGDTTTSVKTGDNSLVGMFASAALLSIAGYVLLKRKEDRV